MNSMLPLFLLLATVHGLVEFSPFRPGQYWLVRLRPITPSPDDSTSPNRAGWYRQLGWHAAATGILLLVLAGRNLLDPTTRGFPTLSLRFAWPWLILGAMGLHLVIDLATWLLFRLLARSPSPGHYAWAFTLSQATHYLSLYGLGVWAADPHLSSANEWLGTGDWSALLPMLPQLVVSSPPHSLALIAVALPTLFGGAILIRLVLATRLLKLPDQSIKRTAVGDTVEIGVYVGLLERLLTLLFLISGQYSAIGFVLVAKSIARFRDLEDRQFAEYYLVGTLLSLTLATAGYLALQVLAASLPPALL